MCAIAKLVARRAGEEALRSERHRKVGEEHRAEEEALRSERHRKAGGP